MAVFSSRQVTKSLKKKGFEQYESTHHTYFILKDQDGKRTQIRTHISRDGQDINDYLISNMAKQVKLNKQQFMKLIECPLSYEAYLEILRTNHNI